MAKPITVILSVILIITTSAAVEQLQCYDCKSTDADRCVDPDLNSPKSTKCETTNNKVVITSKFKTKVFQLGKEDVEARTNLQGVNTTYNCYSVNYKPKSGNDNETGIYRGCVEIEQGIDQICEFMKEEFADSGVITDCDVCDFDKCNKKNIGDGSATLLISTTLIIVNLAICIFVFDSKISL